MEPPSAPPRRGHGPWQGLLLAASLLTLWSPPTTAQLTVESVPRNAAQGKDVLLLVHNLPDNLAGFRWYKGNRAKSDQLIGSFTTGNQTTNPGPVYSHREIIYPNGSLLFRMVTLKDTGSYTLETINMDLQSTEASGSFYVYLENTSGLPAGAITGIVIGVLVALALVAALVCFLRGKRTGRADVQHGPREPQSMASTPGHGPSGGCTALAPLPGHRTAVPIYEELLNPDLDVYCSINHKAEVAS